MKSNLLLATAGLFFLIFESTKFGERREIPEKEKWKKEFLNHASCPYMGELGWTIYYKYTRLQTCSYDKLLYQKVKTKDLQPSKRIIKPPALKKKIHNLGKILLQLQNIHTIEIRRFPQARMPLLAGSSAASSQLTTGDEDSSEFSWSCPSAFFDADDGFFFFVELPFCSAISLRLVFWSQFWTGFLEMRNMKCLTT